MRSSVKRTILLLAAVFISALPLTSLGLAQGTTGVTQFSDVIEENPFGSTILDMRSLGFVKGYPDGTFAPDNSISRAEFITMVVAAKNPNATGKNCFSDVTDDWYARFVCTAKANGWVKGYEDGTFKPANNINFAEAAAVINRAFNLNPGTAEDMWYKPYVTTLAAKSAIPMSISTPEKKISRAETTEIIWRLTTNTESKATQTYDSLTAELPIATSCAAIKDTMSMIKYKDDKQMQFYPIFGEGMGGAMEGEGEIAPRPATPPQEDKVGAQMNAVSTTGSNGDFSTTNTQVEGVDEADVIKNDDQYLYMVARDELKIVKIAPPTEMKEVVSEFKFSEGSFVPSEMYVTKDRLVIYGTTYQSGSGAEYYPGGQTEVFVLDISDRSNPKEIRTFVFDGSVVDSRRIDGKVYLVTSMSTYYLPEVMNVPTNKLIPNYFDSKTGKTAPIAPCSQMRIIPNTEENSFLNVVGFDINDMSAPISKAVVMGASYGTVYASQDNLYIANAKYTYPGMGIFDTMRGPDMEMSIWRGSESSTQLFRFSLENGTVTYKDKGEVPGSLLNQFAMDENGSAFRIVTHTDATYDLKGHTEEKAMNNLYVLNRDSLSTVLGKIENIAPGEDLHSVRFMGKRAYLVTFKQIDPFFVVDLSEPTAPKMLGELKIPGYSDYLHPYDENHIIGFGKEVDPTIDADKVHSDDAVYYTAVQGLKIALFDVTDPANPKAMFKEVIGDQGTDSELLYNHKALLFDKARGIFAFPITVAQIKDKSSKPDPWSTTGDVVFQGAYVYSINLNDGFKLKGKITNFDDLKDLQSNYYGWFDNANSIKRILYIGDYLYGVSLGRVKAVNRDTFTEAGKLDLDLPPQLPVIPF